MLKLKPPVPPMEAVSVDEIPKGKDWQYEPKWDGFRCLAFRDGKDVDLMSKSKKPLTRYFPELAAILGELEAKKFVLDGEIVIPSDGGLSFDNLLQRIHPAASRIEKLSKETPSVFIIFDLLVGAGGESLVSLSISHRTDARTAFSPAALKGNKSE